MLRHRTLKASFGQYYHIHRNSDGAVPRSLQPLKFLSAENARVFLRRLQVSDEYWRSLARDADEMAPQRGHQRDYLQVICNRLASGHLRIYEIQAPNNHLLTGNQTVIQDRRGDQYHFTPASRVLTSAHEPCRFHSIAEVHQRLHDLAPTLEQLQSLVTALQIAPSSQQSLTYTQLVDVLAESLAEEKIALYIQSPFRRPESTGILEASALVPGNRPVPLAPPTKQKPPVSNQETQPLQSAPTNTQAPQNLDECAELLKAARERLEKQGYQAKYTDEQQLAKVQSNEVSQERFLVSFQSVDDDPDAKLAFQRNSGLVPVWATSFDQLENADTDPQLIADILGTPYDSSKDYVLHIVDRGENLDLFGQNTLVPTWDNMQQPVQKYLAGKHDSETLAEVMTLEYQRKYAEHIEVYRSQGMDEFDKNDQKEYSETLVLGDKEQFEARHNVRTEIGANSEFTGNGLTQSRESSTQYGVVETLTLENNPPPISKMKNVRTIALSPRGKT